MLILSEKMRSYFVLLISIAVWMFVSNTDAADLTIDCSKPGIAISPLLYGIFFEEINHAGDGGLYAELIRNRSFEDNPIEGWSLVKTGSAGGSMALESSNLLNSAQTRALRLDITSLSNPSDLIGIANEGFWGINIVKDTTYQLSFYAKCAAGYDGTLTARLQSKNGSTTYATAEITGLTTSWAKYSCTLKPNGSAPDGRLAITSSKSGTIWFDVVSLFPPTFKGRPNGLRIDLANAINDLEPRFYRFPGGSYISETWTANAFRWKTALGPIENRPGHPGLGQLDKWGYRSSDGLGLFEYLQMSEDFGAEPLFCIPCGVSDNDTVPMSQMGPWVQDAVDAIEFANGPATSTWGKIRADMGHPEPFNMKYMEIGNEQQKNYNARYMLFYNAIKAKYPDMKIIYGGTWQGGNSNGYNYDGAMPSGTQGDIIDEHFYYDPSWMVQNVHRFDNYKRTGAKIFIGEIASNDSLIANAVGEAAFLIGCEKNADVVSMICYAPLLCNKNAVNWGVVFLTFNSSGYVIGRPYYTYKMFGNNLGSVLLPIASADANFDKTFFATASRDDKSKDIIIKAANNGTGPIQFTIKTVGVDKIYSGAATVLTADANTTNQITGAGAGFNYSFAGKSVTVLRLITTDTRASASLISTSRATSLRVSCPAVFRPNDAFTIANSGRGAFTLSICDLNGRPVLSLGGRSAGGPVRRAWNGATSAGKVAAGGTYIVIARSGGKEAVRAFYLAR